MASILDLPDFMFSNQKKIYSRFSKLYLTIFGLFIGFIYKKTSGKLFCSIINLFFPRDGKINYSGEFYFKKLWNDSLFFYPNKRIDRIIVDHKAHFNFLFETYCLDEINFNSEDLIIDCGANVGELYMSLLLKEKSCKYVAFEPDPISYSALSRNLKQYELETFELALSNTEGTSEFFLNPEGADSSLVYFGSDSSVEVNTKALDSFKYPQIKLLKIEAEGAELEVLQGSVDTLSNVEYISVDYGPERGVNSESTSPEIVDFLYTHDFKLIKVSKHRQVGLFKNSSI